MSVPLIVNAGDHKVTCMVNGKLAKGVDVTTLRKVKERQYIIRGKISWREGPKKPWKDELKEFLIVFKPNNSGKSTYHLFRLSV